MLRAVNILALVVFCCSLVLSGSSQAQQAMRVEALTIKTAKGEFIFQTEIADTGPMRERGPAISSKLLRWRSEPTWQTWMAASIFLRRQLPPPD